MPYIPKTAKHKYSADLLVIIISLHNKGKLFTQIGNYLNLLRLTIVTIIYRHNRQPDQSALMTH